MFDARIAWWIKPVSSSVKGLTFTERIFLLAIRHVDNSSDTMRTSVWLTAANQDFNI